MEKRSREKGPRPPGAHWNEGKGMLEWKGGSESATWGAGGGGAGAPQLNPKGLGGGGGGAAGTCSTRGECFG